MKHTFSSIICDVLSRLLCRDFFEKFGCTFPKFEGLAERTLITDLEGNSNKAGKTPKYWKDEGKRRGSKTSDTHEPEEDDEDAMEKGTKKPKHEKVKKKEKGHKSRNHGAEHSTTCCGVRCCQCYERRMKG